jgi:hypothetical protein
MHVLVSFKKILKTIFENLYETHNFLVISVKLNYWISCFDKKKKCSKNVIRKETFLLMWEIYNK